MLKLIKDFQDFQFTYFWIEITGDRPKKLSKNLPTLQHAHEWFIDYHHSQHQGLERRVIKQDRRQDSNKKYSPAYCSRLSSSKGRRMTDREIRVDIDLAKKKLQELSSQNS